MTLKIIRESCQNLIIKKSIFHISYFDSIFHYFPLQIENVKILLLLLLYKTVYNFLE